MRTSQNPASRAAHSGVPLETPRPAAEAAHNQLTKDLGTVRTQLRQDPVPSPLRVAKRRKAYMIQGEPLV